MADNTKEKNTEVKKTALSVLLKLQLALVQLVLRLLLKL